MGYENITRNLDLVNKLQLKKLTKEIVDSDDLRGKKLLGIIEALNNKIDSFDEDSDDYLDNSDDDDDIVDEDYY